MEPSEEKHKISFQPAISIIRLG